MTRQKVRRWTMVPNIRTCICAIAGAGAILLFSPSGVPQAAAASTSLTDINIILDAARFLEGDIALAEFVARRTQRSGTKRVTDRVIADDTKLLARLRHLAARAGIDLPARDPFEHLVVAALNEAVKDAASGR